MTEFIAKYSTLESNNNRYKVGDEVICSFARFNKGNNSRNFIPRDSFQTDEGKRLSIEEIPEIKDVKKHGGSRYARGTQRLGTVQYINELAVVVRHTDNCFPNEDYEDAYYLFDEIKPILNQERII